VRPKGDLVPLASTRSQSPFALLTIQSIRPRPCLSAFSGLFTLFIITRHRPTRQLDLGITPGSVTVRS
jgi:hypothetical protein